MTRRDRRRRERAARASDRSARPRRGTPPRPVWQSPIFLATAAAVVVGVALIAVLTRQVPPSPSPSDAADIVKPSASYSTALAQDETLGKADAPGSLDVWSDFQCPYCGEFARTYLPRLVTDFVTPGTLRITQHDVDFRGTGDQDESLSAAVAAGCASAENEYWPFHDLLFWNQNGENQGAFTDARLQAMADQLGLDRSTWNTCRNDPSNVQTVRSTTQQAIDHGINVTPTLIINGSPIKGLPRTYDDLANAIRSAAGQSSSGESTSPSAQ